jgi:hypothetical protein
MLQRIDFETSKSVTVFMISCTCVDHLLKKTPYKEWKYVNMTAR